MTDDEIRLRLLLAAEGGDYVCLHDSMFPGHFGGASDGSRARQIAWELFRDGQGGFVQYDFDSEHMLPEGQARLEDGESMPDHVPPWAEKLMIDGVMRFSRLLPRGADLLAKLRKPDPHSLSK